MRSVFQRNNRRFPSDRSDKFTRITLHLEGSLLGMIRGYTARHSSEAGWVSRADERGIWRCVWGGQWRDRFGSSSRSKPSASSQLLTTSRTEFSCDSESPGNLDRWRWDLWADGSLHCSCGATCIDRYCSGGSTIDWVLHRRIHVTYG